MRRWVIATAAIVILIVLSILFVDRPVAHFAHDEIGQTAVARAMVAVAEVCGAVAIVGLLFGGTKRALGVAVGLRAMTALLVGVSFSAAMVLKDGLKFAFGRPWPETWIRGNPSLIDSNVYGFFPFHGGAGWASFPSGHTTAAASVAAVLWLRVPTGRAVWAALPVIVAGGLVLMDYHFVSDTLAGAALGTAVGIATGRRISGRSGSSCQLGPDRR